MKSDLTLVIMAAGKGSRYGGLKQIDSLGLNEESIMDFSIYDASLAGFNRLVFIIQLNQLDYFKEKYQYLTEYFDIKYAIQNTEVVPFEAKRFDRTKPWGTTHACWSAKEFIETPFCVLNADDYYGRSTFLKIADFLHNNKKTHHGVFVAYKLIKTISKYGSVSRGICTIHQDELKKVHESLSIKWVDDVIIADDKVINPESPVSMNIWGLQPEAIELLEVQLNFFGEHLSYEDCLQKEALLPADIQTLIDQQRLVIHALYADEEWFGITYQEDKEYVSTKLCEMQATGYYPTPLFKK